MFPQLLPTRNQLLFLLTVAAGVVLASWMQVSHDGLAFAGFKLHSICIHQSLGLGCPGCGTTRAGVLLLQGQWQESLRLQPALPLFLLAGFLAWRKKSPAQLRWARCMALLGLALASLNLFSQSVS